MGAWLKLFKDGSSERGSDSDIAEGKASWSRGRLDGIKSVQLFDRTHCCALTMPNTQWHQYDRYMAMLGATGNNMSTKTARVVQAEIKPEHIGKAIHITNSARTILVYLCENIPKGDILISQEHVGLWATVYILNTGKIGFVISQRGAFNGDEQILR